VPGSLDGTKLGEQGALTDDDHIVNIFRDADENAEQANGGGSVL
jgi:hypothetical protein